MDNSLGLAAPPGTAGALPPRREAAAREAVSGHDGVAGRLTESGLVPSEGCTVSRPALGGALAVPLFSRRPVFRWPDWLLLLVLRHLQPTDLARAGRVCRQWHRLACDPHLQACCFMNLYPVWHRQRLERALDVGYMRHCLTFWAGRADGRSDQRTTRPACLHSAQSARTLFFTRMQNMLGTSRFSADDGRSVFFRQFMPFQVQCSPDGRYLAACGPRLMGGGSQWRLWRLQDLDLSPVLVEKTRASGDLWPALTFSADSHRLHGRLCGSLYGVDNQGHLLSAPCNDAASLKPVLTRTPLCPGPVLAAQFSPDGQCLAVVSQGEILLFAASVSANLSANWQRVWVWQPSRHGVPVLIACSEEDDRPVLVFSGNSRHLMVILPGGDVRLASRSDSGWQEQELGHAPGAPVERRAPGGAVLDASGQWLALAVPVLPQSAVARACVTLYRFGQGEGWQAVTSRMCRNYCRDWWVFPLAFDSEGQQLAFPCRQDLQGVRLCVSSTRGPYVRVHLTYGQTPCPEAAAFLGVVCLQFGVTCRQLAAAGLAGVQIWRQDPVLGWISTAWIASGVEGTYRSLHFEFSPDGYHCALAAGDEGEVSVWGPAGDGAYVRKLHRVQGAAVSRLLFTPDASRLVVALRHRGGGADPWAGITCFRLVPPRGTSSCTSVTDTRWPTQSVLSHGSRCRKLSL